MKVEYVGTVGGLREFANIEVRQEADRRVNALYASNVGLRRQTDALRWELDILRRRVESRAEELDAADKTIAGLALKVGELTRKLDAANAANVRLEDDLAGCEAAYERAAIKLEAAEAERDMIRLERNLLRVLSGFRVEYVSGPIASVS